MKKFLALTAFTLLLGACTTSHSFYLMGRTTGISGSGVVPANGQHGGEITITLGGKKFQGRWVYMESGGSIGIGTSTVSAGSASAAATGTFVGLPTGGNGSVMASTSDGSVLRCVFNFSEWDLRGVGVCQDNKGETYDLQIS
jgi:hypothetical protein